MVRRRRNKFGAVRTEVDGITFDSKAEARRYQDLKLREQAGEITALEVHPEYVLRVGSVVIGAYVADFRYYDVELGEGVVEDYKVQPTRTALYRWKKRHLKAEYGIDVQEVS